MREGVARRATTLPRSELSRARAGHGGRGCGFNSIGPPGRGIRIVDFTEPSFFFAFSDLLFVFPLFFAMGNLLGKTWLAQTASLYKHVPHRMSR